MLFIFQILFESHRRREADVNSGVHCPNLEGGKQLSAQVPASVLEIVGYFDPGKAKSVIEAPIFAFPNICDFVLSCVKIHLFFYHMVLMLTGIASFHWCPAKFEMSWAKWRDLWWTAVRSLFDKDNPVKSSKSQHEKPASNIRMLIALNLMANLAQPDSTFCLLSDSEFHHRMRRYRGFQGMLDSTKISQPDLLALRQVI